MCFHQRAWGVPITVFVEKVSGEVLRDEAVWPGSWRPCAPKAQMLGSRRNHPVSLGQDYAASDYEQVTDILDVWFD